MTPDDMAALAERLDKRQHSQGDIHRAAHLIFDLAAMLRKLEPREPSALPCDVEPTE